MFQASRTQSWGQIAAWSVLASGLLIGRVPSLAQQSGQSRPPAQTGGQNEADGMFRSLDANKDGKLTMEDAGANSRQMMQRIFEMAEKPATGSISRDEFQKVFDRHRAGAGGNSAPRNPGSQSGQSRPTESGFPSVLRFLDSDGDQRLTKAELTRLSQLFDRLDANKDGALDAEELRAAERLPEDSAREESGSRPSNPNPSNPRPTSNNSSESRPRPLPSRSPSSATPNSTTRGNAENSRLSGIWRGWVVRGRGENPNEGEMEVELTVEGNRITGRELGTQRASGGLGGGTFTMTGNGNSGNLDADGTEGPQDGRSFMGIYELQGDTLRWCVSNRGRQRPTAMATDRGNYLMILRKQPSRS